MATTSTSQNRSELLFLGKECNHPSCHLNDFLPFQCPACHSSFCQPHFLPSQHACQSPLPLSMQDRIAPQCPICNDVVPTPPGGGDPNEAVERHITSGGCLGMEGGELKRKAEVRRRKQVGEICWRKGCSKVLVVKMKCENCTHSFCPIHRHAKDHHCLSPSPPSSGTSTPTNQPSQSKSKFSRLLPQSMQPPISASSSGSGPSRPSAPSIGAGGGAGSRMGGGSNPAPGVKTHTLQGMSNGVEAKAAAAAAAMRRAGQDVSVPFVKSKTDKRADAEMQSAIKALKARHEKGLLSKQEEVRYAELLARTHSGRIGGGGKSGIGSGNGNGKDGKGGKDGCIVC